MAKSEGKGTALNTSDGGPVHSFFATLSWRSRF